MAHLQGFQPGKAGKTSATIPQVYWTTKKQRSIVRAENKTKQKGQVTMFTFFSTQFYYEQQEQYREYCETDTLLCLHRIEMDCDKRID